MYLTLLGCLVSAYIAAWLGRHCSRCCTMVCINLGFLSFAGFVFGSAAVFIFSQLFQSPVDPALRVYITVYLTMQTVGCFVAFIISAIGHQLCEWFFDKMETLLPRIQALIIRFLQQNWKQLAFSLLLFVNVQIISYMSTAADVCEIVSALFRSEVVEL